VFMSFWIFQHSKNTFLSLKSTKFKIIGQRLSWHFINFLIVKILICPLGQKLIEILYKVFLGFLNIHIQWKYIFNLRKDLKKKISFLFGSIFLLSNYFWIFLMRKVVSIWSKYTNEWMTCTSFKWHVWCHSVAKTGLPLSP